MELIDFSNGFDTLLNSYAVPSGFGSTDNPVTIEVDEYEKSLFLTQAQEEIVLSLYSGRNSIGKGFEETEELRRYLANLVKVEEIEPEEEPEEDTAQSTLPVAISDKSYFVKLPNDLWFITYESLSATPGTETCGTECNIDVVPVKQDEYHRIKKNPFRGANNRRALRLDLADGLIEIICKYTVSKYYVRYMRKLNPIVLTTLDAENAINGVTTPTNCELDSSLHERILQRAVELALISRGRYNQQKEEK